MEMLANGDKISIKCSKIVQPCSCPHQVDILYTLIADDSKSFSVYIVYK